MSNDKLAVFIIIVHGYPPGGTTSNIDDQMLLCLLPRYTMKTYIYNMYYVSLVGINCTNF